MPSRHWSILIWQIVILIVLLSVWEWGHTVSRALLPRQWVPGILDPYFISRPSECQM
jgi:NitT/TauT family transport system permease protein